MHSILNEATETVAERQKTYGHPRVNHDCIARMVNAYLDVRETEIIDAVDMCMINILIKVARFANGRQRDSLVDIAGYAENAALCMPDD